MVTSIKQYKTTFNLVRFLFYFVGVAIAVVDSVVAVFVYVVTTFSVVLILLYLSF